MIISEGGEDNNGLCSSLTLSSGNGFEEESLNPDALTQRYPPSATRHRSSAALEGLTVNKLRFSSLGLYGRQKEIQQLKECLDNLVNEASKRQQNEASHHHHSNHQHHHRGLVFISGAAGTGKSTLAASLRRSVSKQGGLMLTGKFDLFLRGRPLAGIAQACGDLCSSKILQKRQDKLQELKRRLQSTLGEEQLQILTLIIPMLEDLVGVSSSSSSSSSQDTTAAFQNVKNQFHFAFRSFIRVIQSVFSPLVLVLDDLQWADESSLKLLESLITDSNSSILIVGAYRSNEVSDLLQDTLNTLETKAAVEDDNRFRFIKIDLEDLTIAGMHELLTDLLGSTDTGALLSLAEVVHKKTHGNPFYCIQFLLHLEEKHLLTYSLGLLEWKWDIDGIIGVSVSENVVDLVKSQMVSLSSEQTLLLRLAASLGTTFSHESIQVLWESFSENSTTLVGDSEEVLSKSTSLVESLQAMGYWESQGSLDQSLSVGETTTSINGSGRSTWSSDCRWGHDKIQEAATQLTPPNEQAAFNRQVGGVLFRKLNEDQLESALFIVVNLLNEGGDASDNDSSLSSLHNKESDRLNLNMRAAKKAINVSAFESAIKYIRVGISLLPTTVWKNDDDSRSLAIELYSTGAEVLQFLGKTKEMTSYCDVILNQKGLTLTDKFRAFCVIIESTAIRGEMPSAILYLKDILKEYDITFPKNKRTISFLSFLKVLKLKRFAKRLRLEDVKNAPILTDPRRKEQMKFLYMLGFYSYLTQGDLLLMGYLRPLTWSLKYGLTEESALLSTSTGVLLTGVLNDLQSGAKYAKQTLIILDRLSMNRKRARAAFAIYACILSWTSPFRNMLAPLLKLYELGLQLGDIESALWSIYHYILLEFQAGIALEAIADDCQVYIAQMAENNMPGSLGFTSFIAWSVFTLMGKKEEVRNLEEIWDIANKPKIPKELIPIFEAQETIQAAYLGNHDVGAKKAMEKGDRLSRQLPATPVIMTETFLRGISVFAVARRGWTDDTAAAYNHKELKKEATRILRKIQNWTEQGNMNVRHYETLLEAEQAALHSKKHLAKKNYEYAITMSARNGYIHDTALGHERYAEYLLLEEVNDPDEGLFHLKKALSLYQEWGAGQKVELLLKSHPQLASTPAGRTIINLR